MTPPDGGGGASDSPLHFTGQPQDTETGLDDFGARYNDSTLGRWMTPDWSAQAEPVPYADLENPQSLNLYSYVQNNPVTATDPDGHYLESDPGGCTTAGCTVTVMGVLPPAVALEGLEQLQSCALEFGGLGRRAILNSWRSGITVPMATTAGAFILYSRIKGERGLTGSANASNNPTKKVSPLRDKTGKIVGWSVKDPHTGKPVRKSLDWGRAQGLDPATYRAVAVGAGGATAIGLSGIGDLAIAALSF